MKAGTLGVAVITLLAAPAAMAALITIEPDDFEPGTDISQAVPGATLSRIRSDFPGDAVLAVTPREPHWAATGELVFGHSGDETGNYDEQWVLDTDPGFRYGALRVDFEPAATYVDLALIANNIPDFGRIEAYDSSGVMLASAETSELLPGEWERLAIADVGEISYIIAGGRGTDTVCLDSLNFIPEPATGALLLLAVPAAVLRRRPG